MEEVQNRLHIISYTACQHMPTEHVTPHENTIGIEISSTFLDGVTGAERDCFFLCGPFASPSEGQATTAPVSLRAMAERGTSGEVGCSNISHVRRGGLQQMKPAKVFRNIKNSTGAASKARGRTTIFQAGLTGFTSCTNEGASGNCADKHTQVSHSL